MNSTYTVCLMCHQVNRVALDAPAGKKPTCGKCKEALSVHGGISDLDGQSLDILLRKSPVPVVIDFWAPWCGPCRSFAPAFEAAARELGGQAVMVKVNTEQYPRAGQQFEVRGIPTLVVLKNGREANRISGALPRDEFIAWVKQSL